jgi:hypothetical protein
MSFGFSRVKREIKKAIQEASEKKILLFAAASNNGNNKHAPIAFPASDSRVICVNAMNSLGTDLADFNPPVDAGSIATLGVAVKSAYKLPEESKVLSGTSMATPIVASVAAMVVHFVRHLVLEPPKIYEDNYDKSVWERYRDALGEKDVMLEFLKLLSVKVPLKCNFLQPQTKFTSRTALFTKIWDELDHLVDIEEGSFADRPSPNPTPECPIEGADAKARGRVNLDRLVVAKGAAHNSLTEGELSRCLPETRTDLLKQIADWATNKAGKRIFWLCGKAGTGKSTISRTVAQSLCDNGLFGASFFFKRGHADRSHANLLFPTIARQLADRFPEVALAIAASLDKDSLLCDRYLTKQFEDLLLHPLQSVNPGSTQSAGVVLVIDALDECDNSESIRTTLLLLSRVETITSVRLRIFVTSRPELPVELGFKDMSGYLHDDVRLEKVQETSIAHDIRVFYEHQFSKIREESSLRDDELPAHWPGEQNICTLVDQAVPLFIFASTVSRYIYASPQRNLATILRQSKEMSVPGLKNTYLPILNQIFTSADDGLDNERIFDFKSIVGSIVLLYDPLSASALANLLGVQIGDVGRVLRPLHSVLDVPRASDGKLDRATPITLFHLSFRDFLVNPESTAENRFWINARETHGMLGMYCIRLLESGSLKEDVCGLVAPGTRRSEVAKSTVRSSLSEDVAYACCYWVQHFADSEERIKDDSAVHQFLRKHMLHWIEALSWLGRASDVIHNFAALQCIVDVSRLPLPAHSATNL